MPDGPNGSDLGLTVHARGSHGRLARLTPAQESLDTFETASCIFQMRGDLCADCKGTEGRLGDSFFMVNAKGNRVVNEKLTYDSRVRVHWEEPDSRSAGAGCAAGEGWAVTWCTWLISGTWTSSGQTVPVKGGRTS